MDFVAVPLLTCIFASAGLKINIIYAVSRETDYYHSLITRSNFATGLQTRRFNENISTVDCL